MAQQEQGLGPAAADLPPFRTIAPSTWSALLILGLVILVDGLDTGMLAQAIPVLVKEWSLKRSDFGPTLSLALAATALGSVIGGSLGDRLGRRPILIASFLLITAASLGMALSPNLSLLTLTRVVSGLGLGAAMPAATSLMAEIAPSRYRSAAITLGATCVPAGAAIGGVLGGVVLTGWGWRFLFALGALFALFIMALLFTVPESPSVGRKEHAGREPTAEAGLLSPERRRDTLAFWGAAVLGMFATYSILSWLPAALAEAGYPLTFTGAAMTLVGLGGVVSGLCSAFLIALVGLRAVALGMTAIGCLASLAVVVLGLGHEVPGALLLMLFGLQGACVAGTAVVLYPVGAGIYPPAVRATGIGWGVGLGRAASVASPILAGLFLDQAGARGLYAGVTVAMVGCLTALAIVRTRIR
jgi:AAHS family 4-hydroxybenzoate transporter-like MFS transporter